MNRRQWSRLSYSELSPGVLDILNRLKVRIHEGVKGFRYLVVRQSHLDEELLLTFVDSRPLYETTALREQLSPR